MSFKDGLGERVQATDSTGEVERLQLNRELTQTPGFEFALTERVHRLASFHHSSFGSIRGLDGSARAGDLAVVSEAVPGMRLSDVLAVSEAREMPVSRLAALAIVRQTASAIASLHESGTRTIHEAQRDGITGDQHLSHGALAPERIVIGPAGRVVVVDHVFGAALEQLLYGRDRYWTDLRIALPRLAGLPRLDQLADVTQLGVVALSLLLGRNLRTDEYPGQLTALIVRVDEAEPLPPAVRNWVERALQLDPRLSFPTAVEACSQFEQALAEIGCDPSPLAAAQLLSSANLSASGASTGSSASARKASATVSASLRDETAPAPSFAVTLPPNAPAADHMRPMFGKEPASHEKRRLVAVAVAILVLIGGGGAIAARRLLVESEPAAPKSTGTLVVNTDPSGAEATVDGTVRGFTPLTIDLPAGAHRVSLKGDFGDVRSIAVLIKPGTQVAQYVELSKDLPPPPIDETPSPALPVAETTPAPPAEAGPAAGWIKVSTRFPVQLFEHGDLLGSSETERIMVPAGRHELDLVSDDVGYRATRSVTVSAGKVAAVVLEAPAGTLSVNALPWAEVWIDGQRAGETPLGNLTVAAGPHDIILRHPELGEQRQTAVVTLKTPARVAADMRKR
jgi:serine/threonine protein kinase